MKRWLAIALLLLCSCDEPVYVLSSDGLNTVTTCTKEEWVTCVAKACPNGFIAIKAPLAMFDDGIVKCKP